MPTIKQLADELGMTKQGIRKYLNQLPPEYAQKNSKGVIEITPFAAKKIKELVEEKRKPVTGNEPVTKPVTEQQVTGEVTILISMLKSELDSKNATIESQSRQLEQAQQSIQDLTAALKDAQLSAQQAQALHYHAVHGLPEQAVPMVVENEPDIPEPDAAAPPSMKPEQESAPKKKPGLFSRMFGSK